MGEIKSTKMAQKVKDLPGIQESWILSLGGEDLLEKGIATHSSLPWRIPWTGDPGRLQPMRLQRVRQETKGLTHSHAPSNIIDYTTNLILKTTISILYKMDP